MKDGRTHLAHKAEHAVDLDTGAVLAVTLQGADRGDTARWMRRCAKPGWQWRSRSAGGGVAATKREGTGRDRRDGDDIEKLYGKL